jgi:TP901 family phage tail tape measure protein
VALRTVGVRLMAEVSGYVNGMRTAKASTQDFVGQLDKAARAGKLDAVADQAGRMGFVLAGAFALVVNAAAKFDKQMSEVSAVTNATAADMERLRTAALKAGKDTSFSATEAAKAEAELAKAGLSTSQILGGALTGSLSLAAAGSLDLADASEVAAKTMNMFQLEGKDVGHIADVLAAAANKSATDVHGMGEALKMSGLAASNAGMSLEETVGTLSAFADRALAGSDGGTSLKTALMMLQAPSEKSAKLMKELGINAYDAGGNFVGTARLAGILQERLGGLTQEQRNAALATIFGADAMRAASVLYDVGEKGIRDYTAAVDDQGAAAEVAAKKMDNLAGDLEKLKGSLETLAIESGSGANKGLRVLAQGAGALVDEFASLPSAVGSSLTILAGLSGVLMLGFAAWVKSRRAIAMAVAELEAVGPAGARAAAGMQATTKWAGRAAAAFVALEVASAILNATQKDLNIQTEALGQGLANWGRDGVLAGEAARVLGKDMEDLGVGLKFLADTDNSRRQFVRWGQDVLETVVPGLDGTNTSLTRTRERVEAMDQALAGLVQGGHAAEAQAAFDRLAASVAGQGVSVEELRALFPAYAGAVETAGSASGEASGQIAGMGGSAKEAADQVQALKDAFDRLFGIQMSMDEATLRYKQGIIDLNKELKDGAHSISLNTEEGLKNRAAVLASIQDIKALRDARIEHGVSLDAANAAYARDIKGLQASMRAAHFTEKQINELTAAYLGIPAKANTEVKAPGATTAKRQAEDFNVSVKNIPKSKNCAVTAATKDAKADIYALKQQINALRGKTIYINVQTDKGFGGTTGYRWGGITEHAASGLLREAATFAPQGPARYAFAEPATGGEAFIPKRGIPERSMAILDKAASWYGAQVVPGRGSGRGGAVVNNTFHINAGNRDPQAVAAEVSRILAKTGDIWGRGD